MQVMGCHVDFNVTAHIADACASIERLGYGLEAGTYKLTAYVQGDTAGDANSSVYFYVIVNGETLKVDTMLSGYVNWNCAELAGIVVPEGAEVIVGVCVKNAAGGWGTIDAITLVKE